MFLECGYYVLFYISFNEISFTILVLLMIHYKINSF
jgi:hypothetical protein